MSRECKPFACLATAPPGAFIPRTTECAGRWICSGSHADARTWAQRILGNRLLSLPGDVLSVHLGNRTNDVVLFVNDDFMPVPTRGSAVAVIREQSLLAFALNRRKQPIGYCGGSVSAYAERVVQAMKLRITLEEIWVTPAARSKGNGFELANHCGLQLIEVVLALDRMLTEFGARRVPIAVEIESEPLSTQGVAMTQVVDESPRVF